MFADGHGKPSANKILPRGHGLPLAAAIGKRDGVCGRPLLASFADGGVLPMARPSAKKILGRWLLVADGGATGKLDGCRWAFVADGQAIGNNSFSDGSTLPSANLI